MAPRLWRLAELQPVRSARHFMSSLVALSAISLATAAAAGNDGQQNRPPIDWQVGPCMCQLGSVAQIRIPKDFRCTGREGTKRFLELNHNPASGTDLGTVLSPIGDDETYWFAIFTFDEIGYVKDDEKDRLDADSLLASIKKGTDAANKLRRERGWAPLEIVGWERKPFYDERNNHLAWAIRARSEGGEGVNYSTRLLGRYGVMHANLVTSADRFNLELPQFEDSLRSFSFKDGSRYAEFRPGDKIAKYGLTALIAGGAGAALVKSGLLAKFWKLLVAAGLAMAAAIKKFFSGMFGRKKSAVSEDATGPQ